MRLTRLLAPLLLLACLAACVPAATATPTETPNVANTPVEPVLSGVLNQDCGAPGAFATDETGLAVGAEAVNFTLEDTEGNEVRISQLLAEKPVVMIFGSFC
jgi:cytochrome oxidase Cu insertion factor (SCO1/SenC/PrrC family)